VKVDGYCTETNEIFEYLGFFWHGFFACQIYTNTSRRLRKPCSSYEETKTEVGGYRVRGLNLVGQGV